MRVRFYVSMDKTGFENDENDPVYKIIQRIRNDFAAREASSHYSSEPVRIQGVGFFQNEEGTYAEFEHFLFGLPTAIVDELYLSVRRVEIHEEFPLPSSGFSKATFTMPQGDYEHNGAEAIVYEAPTAGGVSRQIRVRVVAETLDKAVELFNLIREGEGEPVRHWIDQPKKNEQNDAVPSEQPT